MQCVKAALCASAGDQETMIPLMLNWLEGQTALVVVAVVLELEMGGVVLVSQLLHMRGQSVLT